MFATYQDLMKVKDMIYRIIILLFLTTSLSAQVKTHVVFETGYEDRHLGIYYDDMVNSVYYINNLYGKLELSAEYKGFSLYTYNKALFIPEKIYVYNPKQMEFTIGGEYQCKSFKIYYEHFCSHSIERHYLSDGYNRIGLRIKIL